MGDAVDGQQRTHVVDRGQRFGATHHQQGYGVPHAVAGERRGPFELGDVDELDRVVDEPRRSEQRNRPIGGRQRRGDGHGDEVDRPVVVGEQMRDDAVGACRGAGGNARAALDRDVVVLHVDHHDEGLSRS